MAMSLKQDSASYIDFLEQWVNNLPDTALASVVTEPDRCAVLCVDVINGFCTIGPLSSPRVQGIVAPIVDLFQAAYRLGVRHFVLPQDTHDPQAVEFAQYPPHAVRGDIQSQTAPELQALPFADDFVIIEKNSISSSENTHLDQWLDDHP